ncbi:MAG: response regulator [Bacteroidetes bacterium]|nr:response regulator [Bacteroidota bacterium]
MSSDTVATLRLIKEQVDLYKKNYNRKLKVLVMDDDEMCLKMVKHQLENSFKELLEIEMCTNYDDFVKGGKSVDIAVIDYFYEDQMSQHDGLSILSKLKNINPLTTVYMMTGHKQINIAIQAIKTGAADYILKGEAGMMRLNENILELLRRKNTYNKRVSVLSLFRKRMGLFM